MSRSLFHGSFWAFDVRVGKAGALRRGVVGQQMQGKIDGAAFTEKAWHDMIQR